jgi:excisionase family DNA binding protein
MSERQLLFIPRGLSRVEAARYIGVSPSTFDKLVEDGTMPKPKHIRARRVWDRVGLDLAFTNLDGGSEDESNEWDE